MALTVASAWVQAGPHWDQWPYYGSVGFPRTSIPSEKVQPELQVWGEAGFISWEPSSILAVRPSPPLPGDVGLPPERL